MPRVYAIESDDEITMVTANSPQQALSHVAKNQFKVSLATAFDVVEYMQAGGEVEHAGDKDPAPEASE